MKKSRIALITAITALTLACTAAAEPCHTGRLHGHAGNREHPARTPQPFAAVMGLALLATGAVTRRSTIEHS